MDGTTIPTLFGGITCPGAFDFLVMKIETCSRNREYEGNGKGQGKMEI
jgi:hypothetical protein